MSHQAGWPAKIITPEELKRGLPPEMKAILLVGLNRFDQTWLWSEGIEGELKKFVAGGGKLIADSETVLPEGVAATKTALKVAAYTTQSKEDVSPQLLARNLENVRVLQSAMAGIEMPLATGSDTVWAVPHQNGDTQYVTVVNWGFEEGKKRLAGRQTAGRETGVEHDAAHLRRAERPKTLAAAGAKRRFDQRRLPPLRPAAARSRRARHHDGARQRRFWTATVATGASGVPVRLEISGNGDGATLFGSSGVPIKLPVGPSDAGTFQLSASELLLNGSAQAQLKATPAPVAAPDPPEIALRRFAARRRFLWSSR